MTRPTHESALARKAKTHEFFEELEEQLLQRIHNEASSDRGRAELLRSTGVRDEILLEELSKLGVTADGLIALRLLPLVLVAWAQEDVDANERFEVLSQAFKIGITQDTTAWILLQQWLTKRPPGLCVDAWKRYTHGLFGGMSDVAKSRLIHLTETQMNQVAKASGGHFGFGKVSKKESAIIHQISTAMRQQSSIK
ncbi:hypothetical protein [Aporhodopirellula aestuarii]|uniref:Uncharacterized protein n=1 Tax=Aporhodopirellula aestuarii TaxID=2950107 RepID=A0ABT0TYR4_9BACT|nr:hypothetical protein [Aporhodopirellula aestuarii]MCM2369711.1 hypothetical protein [Aporhodopirellula aestuarii]